MKQILAPRKKINPYKRISWYFLIFFFHYFAFISYVMFFRINSIIATGSLFTNNNFLIYEIYYFIFIGPGINAFMHLMYLGNGSLSSRAFMWINSSLLIVSMPVLSFFV